MRSLSEGQVSFTFVWLQLTNPQRASFQFVEASAERVDVDAKQLVCKTLPQLVCALHRPGILGEPVRDVTFALDYDILVFAVGAVPNTFNTPGVAEARC